MADISYLNTELLLSFCYYLTHFTSIASHTVLCQTGLYQNIRQANLCCYCQQNPELSKWRKNRNEVRKERKEERLESDTFSANNSNLEAFLKSMCELFSLYCNYFINLSLLAGFVALEQTAKHIRQGNLC